MTSVFSLFSLDRENNEISEMMWGGKRNWKPRCTSASYKSESSKDASYWAGGPRGYVLKVVILLESWKYHRNLSVAKLLRASWRLEADGEISTLP